MKRKNQIGFSQRIQLEWLEQTATLVLAGNSKTGIQTTLQEILKGELSVGSDARWGNRGKSITILLNTWVTVDPKIEGLREDGLELLSQTPTTDHLPIHWGMAIAAYPFLGSVTETVGRLLQLQDEVAAPQVQQRLREQFGERETVSRAARRILRCFVDWGILQDSQKKGVYVAATTQEIQNPRLAAWLIEAVLLSKEVHSSPLQAIIQSPILFPFSINLPISSELVKINRLELFRQGLDIDVIALRS